MRIMREIAAKAAKAAYSKHTDLGTTEYNLETKVVGDREIQVLAIAGSNEPMDWLLNFNICSWKGIKWAAYSAAKDLHAIVGRQIEHPLLVTGHSKAGATAIAFKKLYPYAYWCYAFNPARSLRYWATKGMQHTFLYINAKDPVSKAGFINFGHPESCIEYKTYGDNLLDYHSMDQWL